MSYLETKYVNLLSTSLRNFKRKGGNLYNFSCPFCGDSQRSRRKARGYVYSTNKGLLYSCHNCGLTTNIPKLLKHCNPLLHEEYVKEMLAEKYQPKKDRFEEFTEQVKKPVDERLITKNFLDLESVYDLPKDHPCKLYVEKRKIPKDWHSRLYYCPAFFEWTNLLIPDKFSKRALERDEGRLIIPLISKDKKIFGYQGRSLKENLDKDEQRYYTLRLDDSYPMIFGLDKVDEKRKFYVTEGPIDSIFLPNAVAVAGGGLSTVGQYLKKENAILIYDNEPRSRETQKKMQKAINLDYTVMIWPESFHYKDINEAVMAGVDASYIKSLVDEHSKKGLEAQLSYNAWKKI